MATSFFFFCNVHEVWASQCDWEGVRFSVDIKKKIENRRNRKYPLPQWWFSRQKKQNITDKNVTIVVWSEVFIVSFSRNSVTLCHHSGCRPMWLRLEGWPLAWKTQRGRFKSSQCPMFYTHLYEHIYEFDFNLTEHVNIQSLPPWLMSGPLMSF